MLPTAPPPLPCSGDPCESQSLGGERCAEPGTRHTIGTQNWGLTAGPQLLPPCWGTGPTVRGQRLAGAGQPLAPPHSVMEPLQAGGRMGKSDQGIPSWHPRVPHLHAPSTGAGVALKPVPVSMALVWPRPRGAEGTPQCHGARPWEVLSAPASAAQEIVGCLRAPRDGAEP